MYSYVITKAYQEKNAKHLLLTASQMQEFVAFLSFISLQIKHLNIIGWQ